MTERDIFIAALQMDDPVQRQLYLDKACALQPELRRQVAELLQLYEKAGSFLQNPAAGSSAAGAFQSVLETGPSPEGPGTNIGSYKLLEQIGEGGFGIVFMAEQTKPVQRKVALKVIKPGMDTRQIIARFEAERQALALMDHVNIARVIDGGTTESGRPYFVMELVHGVPITKYCDENHLTPRERLELFIPVCQAIQHAHQKGIIHRDIKPSNVLVTLYDGKPVPKVIDFGVAKAIEQKLTERSFFTDFGMMVGTLEYMSPEQAEMSGLGVDTRSDIYSLGVLLYELLTGSTPLSHKRMKAVAYAEILRIIKEEEPPKPSTRLCDSGQALASLSAQRKTEPAKLTKLVRGELDWIVMKTLEKDRNRRYETASSFAADVQRYLADEVVEARPPNAGYRLLKIVRRYRGPLLAASLVVLALLGGTIAATLGLIEAKSEHAEALAQKTQAETNAAEAQKQEKEAKDQLALSTAVTEFLQNDLLGQAGSIAQADRKFEPDPDLTMRSALDRAAAAVGDKFKDRPELEANIRQTIGNAYREIGQYKKAIAQLQQSVDLWKNNLGPDHLDTLFALYHIGGAYKDAGRMTEAIAVFEQVRGAFVKKLGPDHPDTLNTLNNLAVVYKVAGRTAEAITLLEQVSKAKAKKLGPEHTDTLFTLDNLAGAYKDAGRTAEAIALYQQDRDAMVKNLGPNHPSILTTLNNLAVAYLDAGKTTEAIVLFEQVRDTRVKRLGPEHPDTVNTLGNLALAYGNAGRTTEAIALLEQVRDAKVKQLGPDHQRTLATLNNLAAAYQDARRTADAITLFEQVRNSLVKTLGPDHPDTINTLGNLASAYRDAGKMTEAIALLEQVRDAKVKKLGPDHPRTLASFSNLAAAYWSMKQLDKSIPLFEQTLAARRKNLGELHPDTLITLSNLGVNYRDAGRLEEAIPLLEQAYRERRNHASLSRVGESLLLTYVRAGKTTEASRLVKENLVEARKAFPADSLSLAAGLDPNGWALLQLKAWPDAEPVLRECLAIRDKQEPDAWTTFSTKSMLGEALLGQKKHADAESLLLTGYEGMNQREEKIPPQAKMRLVEALERLVQFYDAQNNKPEVEKWRKLLETRKEAEKKKTKS